MTDVFKSAQKCPTNLQLAISIYSVAVLSKASKSIWYFPAGFGKSFMENSAALIALTYTTTKRVSIIVPDANLLSRDHTEFKAFWELTGFADRVRYCLDFPTDHQDGELFIVDEIDQLMYRDLTGFFKKTEQKLVIGFTATGGDFYLKGEETKAF
jgi:hypothetical protein